MTYGEDRIKAWWESCRGDLEKIGKLSIYSVTDAEFEALAALARRHMRIAVTVQDRVVWVADAQGSNIEIKRVPAPDSGKKKGTLDGCLSYLSIS